MIKSSYSRKRKEGRRQQGTHVYTSEIRERDMWKKKEKEINWVFLGTTKELNLP